MPALGLGLGHNVQSHCVQRTRISAVTNKVVLLWERLGCVHRINILITMSHNAGEVTNLLLKKFRTHGYYLFTQNDVNCRILIIKLCSFKHFSVFFFSLWSKTAWHGQTIRLLKLFSPTLNSSLSLSLSLSLTLSLSLSLTLSFTFFPHKCQVQGVKNTKETQKPIWEKNRWDLENSTERLSTKTHFLKITSLCFLSHSNRMQNLIQTNKILSYFICPII